MNKLEYRLKSGEKKGAEEGVWKRGSFGNDPPLMGHVFIKIGWQFHLQGTVVQYSGLLGLASAYIIIIVSSQL